jgi:hypothetical protein
MSSERAVVFVSYADEDKEICRRLVLMLGLVLGERGYGTAAVHRPRLRLCSAPGSKRPYIENSGFGMGANDPVGLGRWWQDGDSGTVAIA